MKVLVTDGGRGQAHGAASAVRALAAAGHEVHVSVTGRYSTAAWSRHARRRIRVPAADDPAYAEELGRLRARESYDVVFPTSDVALLRLGWPGAELVDKEHLHTSARAAGLATPRQWRFPSGEALLEQAGTLPWPVAVKPVERSSASVPGAFRADAVSDLDAMRDFPGPLVVEEWLSGEQSCVAGVTWQGRLRAVVHQRYVRTWPRECGDACFAITTDPDEELEAGITAMLAGYDGMFQCELIDGRVHDLNPRIYGSVSLAVGAGVNLPDLVCRLTAGEDVGAASPLRGRPGVQYRWVEGEVRHLRAAHRERELTAREALRAVRPRRGVVRADLWPSDPGPTLARLAYAGGRGRESR